MYISVTSLVLRDSNPQPRHVTRKHVILFNSQVFKQVRCCDLDKAALQLYLNHRQEASSQTCKLKNKSFKDEVKLLFPSSLK